MIYVWEPHMLSQRGGHLVRVHGEPWTTNRQRVRVGLMAPALPVNEPTELRGVSVHPVELHRDLLYVRGKGVAVWRRLEDDDGEILHALDVLMSRAEGAPVWRVWHRSGELAGERTSVIEAYDLRERLGIDDHRITAEWLEHRVVVV